MVQRTVGIMFVVVAQLHQLLIFLHIILRNKPVHRKDIVCLHVDLLAYFMTPVHGSIVLTMNHDPC